VANFVVAVDRVYDRRRVFQHGSLAEVAPVEGLTVDHITSGPVSVVWAKASEAPLTQSFDAEGGAVIWGDAIEADNARRATADDVRAAWSTTDPLPSWDGFHAMVRWDSEGGLVVGADILGFFPVYWWTNGEVVLAGSSPELFFLHPSFDGRLDPRGLPSVFLTNGLVGGRTLWRGVRRLAPGRVLRAGPGRTAEEVIQYRIPISRELWGLPFRGHLDIVGEVFAHAMKRHAPGGRAYGMLLSGGLDSRMLAGYLDEQEAEVEALTLGMRSDLEMRAARSVAKHLAYPQRTMEVSAETYPRLAQIAARWEHLSNGFSGMMDWALYQGVSRLPSHTVVGYVVDSVVGGIHNAWGYDEASRSMSFDKLFRRVSWGMSPEDVKKLLPDPMFREAVDEIVDALQSGYRDGAALESHRAWLFELGHRQRFHVGVTTWLTSFGSWPVLPILDRRLIGVLGGVPPTSLSDRRLQRELVIHRFPDLARLPLDRNSHNTLPLSPRMRDFIVGPAGIRLRQILGRLTGRRRDLRYFFRTYAFDSPGWLEVRRDAETDRPRIRDIADPAEVDRHWPGPDVRSTSENVFGNTSAAKVLIGMAFLSRIHPLG